MTAVIDKLPRILGFIANSLNEWRGKIAAVVFLEGCNWRCSYCHGWRFITESDQMPEFSIETILTALDKNQGWIDGVVVTGGEATLHPELPDLIRLFRQRKLAVKLHTNGSNPKVLEALLRDGLLNCIALDFKAPLVQPLLERVTDVKVDVDAIKKSFALAAESGLEHEFHTTLCPALLSWDEVSRMATELAQRAPLGRWLLQQYNSDDVLNLERAGKSSYTLPEVEGKVSLLKESYQDIEIRGF